MTKKLEHKARKYNWYFPNLTVEIATGGWKQSRLAQIAGMSNVTLCHVINGTYTLKKNPFSEEQKRLLALAIVKSRRYLFAQKIK